MKNKRRIFVTIHYRGQYSLREHRQRLGHAAYHWGILISPKSPTGKDCYAYDATDGIRVDPTTGEDLNPERDWFFREHSNVDLLMLNRLLGRVMIGKVPDAVTYGGIRAQLAAIPLPAKGAVPVQNCADWVRDGVRKLQEIGFADKFDVEQLMDAALTFADECIKKPDSTAVINYTRRPM